MRLALERASRASYERDALRSLREVLPLFEKPSQNQIAEMFLRTLGWARSKKRIVAARAAAKTEGNVIMQPSPVFSTKVTPRGSAAASASSSPTAPSGSAAPPTSFIPSASLCSSSASSS